MVVDLCLAHFNTTAHCSKVCADGYDVTNLVSSDPALRRRGFKLEYFLRPPVQVTLTFGFQVEVCRVDVELWPWGMDRGQACKRLEISTSSDPAPSSEHGSPATNGELLNVHVNQKKQQNDSHGGGGRSRVESGWSRTDSSSSESDFKLVARCEMREATKISFARSSFRPRAPFPSPPPPVAPDSRQAELWSRGELSLRSVSRLRVTMPFGGSASSQGLKALSVWGQPAASCPPDHVERIKRLHDANARQHRRPAFFSPSAKKSSHAPHTEPSPSVPEEFLDPLTQEVMTLPMLLPSGVSVDHDTLEEYRRREATWGRAPNDPFTGVPFTPSSQPLPNPLLKSRIDHFLLETGTRKRDGTLGRKAAEGDLQTSRLLSPSQDAGFLRHGAENKADPRHSERSADIQTVDTCVLDRRKKRTVGDVSVEETVESTAHNHSTVGAKKPKVDPVFANGGPSHEQRLSASLDEALFSALQGRPSFTSNLTQSRKTSAEPEGLNTKQRSHRSDWTSVSAGEKTCSACSCPLSLYSSSSSSSSSVYRLTCGHLLCRTCVQNESRQTSTSKHVPCPRCQSLTPGSGVVRVHH